MFSKFSICISSSSILSLNSFSSFDSLFVFFFFPFFLSFFSLSNCYGSSAYLLVCSSTSNKKLMIKIFSMEVRSLLQPPPPREPFSSQEKLIVSKIQQMNLSWFSKISNNLENFFSASRIVKKWTMDIFLLSFSVRPISGKYSLRICLTKNLFKFFIFPIMSDEEKSGNSFS